MLPGPGLVKVEERAARARPVAAGGFELSVVGFVMSLRPGMGFFSAAVVLLPTGNRRVAPDAGGLFSEFLAEAAGANEALLALPDTNGLLASEPGLSEPFLTSSTELIEERCRCVGVEGVAAVRLVVEEGFGRVGGLLRPLPGVALVAVLVAFVEAGFEADDGVGAAGLFGAAKGRFGGTDFFVDGPTASFDLSGVRAGATVSSTGRLGSIDS